MLLDRGSSGPALKDFDICGNSDRFYVFYVPISRALSPGQELLDCPVVGGSCVGIPDRDRKEFEELFAGRWPGAFDECREPRVSKAPQKNLVTSALSWFKVLRAKSMNQKFPYILRIIQKAKQVRFQVSVEKGLEIVVPKRFSASRVPALVEQNSRWIEWAFQKAKAFQGLIGPAPVWQMPEEITSLALDLTWRVLTRRDDMKMQSSLFQSVPHRKSMGHISSLRTTGCWPST